MSFTPSIYVWLTYFPRWEHGSSEPSLPLSHTPCSPSSGSGSNPCQRQHKIVEWFPASIHKDHYSVKVPGSQPVSDLALLVSPKWKPQIKQYQEPSEILIFLGVVVIFKIYLEFLKHFRVGLLHWTVFTFRINLGTNPYSWTWDLY